MKLQKWLALSLSALMAVSLLAGCGSAPASTGGSTPASTDGASAAAEPVNIVWAGWSGEEEASKEIFQRMRTTYEEASGNTVTWVGWTWPRWTSASSTPWPRRACWPTGTTSWVRNT